MRARYRSADIAGLPAHLADVLTVIRHPQPRGNIAGRNEIMRAATTDYVLLCDDDAYLLDAETIRRGLERDGARHGGGGGRVCDGRA